MGLLSGKGGRLAVAGGAILLLLSAIAGYVAFGPGGPSSRRAPREAGPTAAGSDRAGSRASLREQVRDGRFAAPLHDYLALAPEPFQAEDLYLLGMACLKRDRVALGWSALEAARRLDPRHRQTGVALEEIQARLGKAAGEERTRLHRAADVVELLSAARGGAPLGMLALGLARYADSAGREEEFLDRLSLKPRAVVEAVRDPSGALKLVARLLLETARPDEAMELLRSIPPKPEGEDHEIPWLLSRAALQLDDQPLADEMLAQADGFGDQDTSTPEPAPFVGSKKCGECHRALYRAQQGSSRHATTLWSESGLKDIPLPEGPIRDPSNPGITHTFHRRAADRIELESSIDDKVYRAVIAYAIGSGHHGMTMVGKDPSGTHYELRISYYANGKAWDRTKTSVIATREGGQAIGMEMTRKDIKQCLHCHTTWFRAVDDVHAASRGPEAQDRGIGCERCHGPGLHHVKAVETGFRQSAIAQTARTPGPQRLQPCNECHASNGSVAPDDPEFVRVQGTTFTFSRCFTASKGQFDCNTCHDPHRALETSVGHYEEKCLGCHAPAPEHPATASSGGPGAAVKGTPCPVNPASGCIECHMPRVDEPVLHTRFTDHHIRVHAREPETHGP